MFCIAHAPNCQISNVGGARMLHMRRYRSKSSLNIIVPPQRILSTSLAARHTRETSFYQHRVIHIVHNTKMLIPAARFAAYSQLPHITTRSCARACG